MCDNRFLATIVLVITIIISMSALVQAVPPPMPSIFDRISKNGSYHMMSELEITNGNNKDRLVIEEWVSLSLGLARVDILQSDERITFLTNGQTGEKFMYQDYTCNLLDDYWPKLKKLNGFLQDFKIEKNENFKKDGNIFGIGAMWMVAKATKVKNFLKARSVASMTRPLLYNYDRYNVTIDSGSDSVENRKFWLNLYFEPGVSDDDSTVGKPNDLRELQLIEWTLFDEEVDNQDSLVRAKIFFFEQQIESHHLSLFDLPEGYGCQRSRDYSHPLEERFKFTPIDLETPQQMTLDVALMLSDEVDQTIWSTQTATVKLIAGKIDQVSRYVIVESQQRLPNVQPPKIKRLKNIYDLSNEYHDILYSMDQETNECTVEKVSGQFGSVIEFHGGSQQQNKSSSASPVEIKFNIDNINTLFADNSEFHLIKTMNQSGESNLQMLVHERFVDSFEAGSLRGTASIVRKTIGITTLSQSFISNLPANKQTIVIIYVYGMKDDDKKRQRKYLKAKITLRLYEHMAVNRMYLHKQLDISSCVADQKKEYAVIKYPLERPDNGQLLAASTDSIYLQFIRTMFLVVGLEPIQLCKVEITFDNYNMFVRMLLVDGPPKHMRYKLLEHHTLKKGPDSGVLIEEIQATNEKCAEACEFYKCQGFSYCTNSRCTLYIRDIHTKESSKTFGDSISPSDSCSLYEDNNTFYSSIYHDMSPHKIIARLRDWIKLSEDTTDEEATKQQATETSIDQAFAADSLRDYLSLHIKLFGFEWVHLTPISIESDLFDEDDLFRERKFNLGEQSLLDSSKDVRNYLTDKLVQAQYLIEIEGRKFDVPSKDFQYSVSDHLSYQDCATFCHDTDCRSFSYCDTQMECVVTKLHKPTIIQSHIVKDAHCTISMRDYLSKFELFSNAPKPETDIIEKFVKNVRECASICMESSDIDCLSFDYCSQGECYLHKLHGRTTMVEKNFRNVVTHTDSCDHYSRSYLADFDKYLEAHLEIPENAIVLPDYQKGSLLEREKELRNIITGVDTETCAKLCIENDDCSGFTVCFDPLSSIKQECSLAQVPLKKSYVAREHDCNTYLLSPKSQFNTLTRRVILTDPKDNKEQLAESEKALSHSDLIDGKQKIDSSIGWVSSLILLFLGAAIGSGLVMAFKNRERLQQVVQNFK